MDLSLKYSKTSKGAKAVLAKSKALSSSYMLVLSNIDGKIPASALQAKLQLSEEKFTQALSQLLNEAYIQVVQDFGPSVLDLRSAIEVSEISAEEFFKLDLPEETTTQTQEQIEAEERARLYAEEQARKEAQAREQEESERKLLNVTDILAKSGHKIDIEKLAEGDLAASKPNAIPKKEATHSEPPPNAPPELTVEADDNSDQTSLDFTQPLSSNVESAPSVDTSTNIPEIATQSEIERRKQAEEQARQVELHKREEAKQRQQAEAVALRARAEQQAREEAQARAKAEEEAHLETERIRREEAQAQARRKAEEKARKEEERRARKEAEAARKLAEKQAREEAQEQARVESERRAKEEAERRAQEKAEAEARAREAAERKAREKAEAEARAREAAERKAQEKAELQAQRAAEAEVRAEAARKARDEARLRNEQLAAEKAAAKAEAKREAEVRALVRAEEWAHKRAALHQLGSLSVKRLHTFGRPVLIGFSVIAVALLVLLHFVSLAMWIPPVEQTIAANIGEPVKIRDMRISLWPHPHMVLDEVTIGPLADVRANQIRVSPVILTLLKEHKVFDSVEVEGLSIDQEDLQRPSKWLTTAAQQRKLKVTAISIGDIMIRMPQLELPVFNADIQLSDGGEFASASLHTDNLVVNIAPTNNVFTVNILGKNWEVPLGPAITFDELAATGTLENSQLNLKKVEGSLYGGTVQGVLSVDWANGWRANGNFELIKIDLAQATPAVSELASLQGRLYAVIDIDSNANDFVSLIDDTSLRARFEAEQGQIGGLDLSRAAAGREQAGGNTRYEQVSGNWIRKNQSYQLTQVALKAGSLAAQGEISISPEQNISGRVLTQLDLGARDMQARFNLVGKLGGVRIQR